jgi:outer membrane lipoprotein-sorting protein
MKKKLLLIVALFGVFVSGCKQEDEEPKDLLLHKTWKRTRSDKNNLTNPSGRILYAAVLSCQKDDAYKFNSDGTLSITSGTEKCITNELANKNVTYSHNEITKELMIDGIKYTLAEESEDQIKYYAALPSESGSDYIVFMLE